MNILGELFIRAIPFNILAHLVIEPSGDEAGMYHENTIAAAGLEIRQNILIARWATSFLNVIALPNIL